MTPLPKSFVAVAAALLLGTGCELRQAMYDQQKYEPLEKTDFFGDNRAARNPVEGTVAVGFERADDHLYRGTVNGEPAKTYPFPIAAEELARGREQFEIHCSVCHGLAGHGDGMVVQRGFNKPTSLFDPRLLTSPPGHFYQIITAGKGVMPSYAPQVAVEDRWKIVAYIQTLQLSQHAAAALLSEDDRKKLE